MQRILQPQSRAADTGGVGLSASGFADLYGRHMPDLVRYCRGILRDREDAEDAAQSAMERALRALGSAPEPERVRPWLFTIAQREAITLLRRRRWGTAAALDEAALPPQSSPEDVAAVRERLAELLEDLRELAPRQRDVLVARELGGRSYRDIAADLGTTEAAAQQCVLEARRSLRQFEAGRSLACDDVQAWLSAHDRGRTRPRGVRAHLRACSSCRGFEHGIRARRRDLALLLPGLAGGGSAWSSLAALLGQAGGKALAAGAVIVTGATLTATAPLLREDAPGLRRAPAPTAAAAAAAGSGRTVEAPVLVARFPGHPRAAAPPRRRERPAAPAAGRRPAATAPGGRRIAGGSGPAPAPPAPRPDRARGTAPPEPPAPAAEAPAQPAPAPRAPTLPLDAGATLDAVRDAVPDPRPVLDPVAGAVGEVADGVRDAVPRLPLAP